MRFVVSLAITLVLAATPVAADEVREDPLQRQVLQIAAKLRCAVCQNQPVSESQSDLAKDMRVLIREQLEAGKTEKEITDFFVARYGDYVLMRPRTEGIGLPLWLFPPLLLLIAGATAYAFVRRRIRRATPAAPQLSPEDAERVRAARGEDGPAA